MDKVLAMIGMAKRAGKVTTGAPLCEKAVRSGRAKLVIIAEDISKNGKKAMTDCCKHYRVPWIQYATKSSLGEFTGAEERAVAAISDEGLAKAVLDRYRKGQ